MWRAFVSSVRVCAVYVFVMQVEATMRDLRAVGVDVVTLGQYLRPTESHLAVEEYVHPDVFRRYQEVGFRV